MKYHVLSLIMACFISNTGALRADIDLPHVVVQTAALLASGSVAWSPIDLDPYDQYAMMVSGIFVAAFGGLAEYVAPAYTSRRKNISAMLMGSTIAFITLQAFAYPERRANVGKVGVCAAVFLLLDQLCGD